MTALVLKPTLKQYTNEKKGSFFALTLILVLFFSRFNSVIDSHRIVLDYSDLPEKYKDLFDSDEVRREGDRLQRHVNDLSNTIQRIQAPNMRVSLCCLVRHHYYQHQTFTVLF